MNALASTAITTGLSDGGSLSTSPHEVPRNVFIAARDRQQLRLDVFDTSGLHQMPNGSKEILSNMEATHVQDKFGILLFVLLLQTQNQLEDCLITCDDGIVLTMFSRHIHAVLNRLFKHIWCSNVFRCWDLGNCLADILGKVENLFLLLRSDFHPAVLT
ncbi:unnamed protein product [Arctogadus glacialis]